MKKININITNPKQKKLTESIAMQQRRAQSRRDIGWPMHSEDEYAAWQAAKAADTSERSWDEPVEMDPMEIELSKEEQLRAEFEDWLEHGGEEAPWSIDPDYHSLD